ncbi:MAG: drug resistance transporter, drug antiporter-2 family [Burkholderiales bacterium]|jgi:EmrB/QacA subfamily drug resistance transporter|nr:drug resistance transporter, drug antiporter-2 family [Burkholderiales bacterium]
MNYSFSKNKKWWVLIGVGIASFLGCIDFTIVTVTLPAIQNDLHATIEQLQWIINIFILALSSFMVVMGRLADIYGRQKVLYIGMTIFAGSSLLAGCAVSIQWLIFWRLIQGISCAILYTASGAIISHIFSVEERGRAMGIFFGISFTGLAAGPVLGGLIVGALSWRWVFLVNIPIMLLSLVICILSVPRSRDTALSTKIDYLGALILTLAISSLIFTITQGNNWGWASYKVLILLLFSVTMFIILYYIEEQHKSPIIKFSLLINRGYISGIIANFFLSFFYSLAFFLMPLFLHTIRHESAYTIGLMLLPTTLMVVLLSPIVGKIVDRRGPQKPLLWGFALFIISAALQTYFQANTPLLVILAAFIIMGIAWGLIVGPSTILAINSLPRSSEALAIGTSWTFHNIGGSLGLSIGTAIYHIQYVKYNNSFIAGYHSAMLLLVASSMFTYIFLYKSLRKINIILISNA